MWTSGQAFYLLLPKLNVWKLAYPASWDPRNLYIYVYHCSLVRQKTNVVTNTEYQDSHVQVDPLPGLSPAGRRVTQADYRQGCQLRGLRIRVLLAFHLHQPFAGLPLRWMHLPITYRLLTVYRELFQRLGKEQENRKDKNSYPNGA